jgi:hypothetical protein
LLPLDAVVAAPDVPAPPVFASDAQPASPTSDAPSTADAVANVNCEERFMRVSATNATSMGRLGAAEVKEFPQALVERRPYA